MICGCIGERLPHALFREIHEAIAGEGYELRAIAPEALTAFLRERSFRGVNVTGSLQQAVLPHLDWLSESARAAGAADTIVNRNGLLCGYNAGCEGLAWLVRHMNLQPAGKKVLILGADGASRAALHAVRGMGAAPIVCAVGEEAARQHGDAEIIVNATPREASPEPDEAILPLDSFQALRGVIDMTFDPLRSRLVLQARARGVPAEGGLYMLAAQSVRAEAIFRDTSFPDGLAEEVYSRVLRRRENIVLTGMPGSGKSAVARVLGERLGRPVVDVDARVVERAGLSIPAIFARFGEPRFRDLESEIVAEAAAGTGLVIATGGGTVLRPRNVTALRQNGRLFLLDRPLWALTPSDDRPLGNTREKIVRLYGERMPLYRRTADEIIPADDTPEAVAAMIESR